MMRTSIYITAKGTLCLRSRNGRRFGLCSTKLLQLCVKFRQEGKQDLRQAAQRTLAGMREGVR